MEEQVQNSVNQNAEVIDNQEQQSEAPVTTQETPSAPEGIKVRYNKEDRVIGFDEAPAYIQKGLNYDKVQERATQLEQQVKGLERAAQYYGFDSVDAYLTALEQAEQDKKVQQDAERYGVPEDFIRSELQPLRGELDQLRSEREQLKLERMQVQVQQELSDVKSRYPDFESYGDQVYELVTQKGYGIEHAYMVASYQDKLANTRKQAEAETIRNLQQNAETSTGALGQGDVEHKTGFVNLSREEQRKMIDEVKQGRRTSLN